MRGHGIGWIAVLALLPSMSLAALADPPPTPSVPSTTPTVMTPAQILAQPVPKTIFDIDTDGTALHLQSQMQCPTSLDGAERNQLHAYDHFGFDVSCNYRSPDHTMDITLYLTWRNPASLAADFESEKKSLLQNNPGAAPRAETLPPPPGLAWQSAGYDTHGGTMRDDLLLTSLSQWELQMRATYTDQNAGAAAKLVTDLAAKVITSAGPHLAVCVGSPPPARAGQRFTDTDKMMPMQLAGILAAKNSTDPAHSAAAVWCAETGLSGGGNFFLAWRNVAFDGKADGQVDRITSLADDNPRIVETIFDAADTDVATKLATQPIYDVVVDDPDTLSLVGFYQGRPAITDVANLALGRFGIYARAGKTNHQVQIFKPF